MPTWLRLTRKALRMPQNTYVHTEEASGVASWFSVLTRDTWPIGSETDPTTFVSTYPVILTAIMVSVVYDD